MLHWCNTAKYLLAQRRAWEELLKSRIDVPSLQFSLLLILGTCSCREVLRGGGGKRKVYCLCVSHALFPMKASPCNLYLLFRQPQPAKREWQICAF